MAREGGVWSSGFPSALWVWGEYTRGTYGLIGLVPGSYLDNHLPPPGFGRLWEGQKLLGSAILAWETRRGLSRDWFNGDVAHLAYNPSPEPLNANWPGESDSTQPACRQSC